MERVKELLRKPWFLAGLALFVLVLLFLFVRSKSSGTTTSTTQAAQSVPIDLSGSTTGTTATPTVTDPGTPAPSPVTTPPPSTSPPASSGNSSSPPPTTPTNPTQPSGSGWGTLYSVQGGDTLSGIAAKYGTTAALIYQHNTNTINQWAANHGYPVGPNPMNNIFPGEPLYVP